MQTATSFKVYNASAGSGKTFTLVKEYLKIVLATKDIFTFQKILAITFTNKAANEMKERILDNLRAFADDDFNDMAQMLCEEIPLSTSLLQKRATVILREIINNYSAFSITTIDSFTYKIIRSFAFDLGLSLNFDVELKTKNILNEAVEILISKIGQEDQITKTLLLFALFKWQKDETWDVSFALKSIANLLVKEDAVVELEKLKDKQLPDYLDLHKRLRKQNLAFEKEASSLGKEGLEIIKNSGVAHNVFLYSDLPNFFKKLTEKNYDTISFEGRLAKNIEKDSWLGSKADAQDKLAIASHSEDLKSLYLKAEAYFSKQYKNYVLADLILKNLIPLSVLSELNNALDTYKTDNNIRLNSEFNSIIRKHIKNEPVPFIYEKIGEKYSHFFIDEMQDTSTFQWENLVPLIANALHQPNSSLFLVGDAKQAIYRWRGGKAQQFMDLASEGEETSNSSFFIPKKVEYLETNYRSFSEIVDFNNSFFTNTAKFLSNPKHNAIYKNENNQKKTEKQGGYIQIDFLAKGLTGEDKSNAYADTIISILNNLDNAYTLGDVCILVRGKKEGTKIAENLTAAGFDIMTSESLLLCNDEKVNFIVNFLTYLVNDTDKKVLADALIFLHKHLNVNQDIHGFITEHLNLSKSKLFNALKKLGITFSDNQFNEMSLYQSVAYLVRCFNLVNTSDAFIQFFLDEVLKFEQKQKDNLVHFLAYFDVNKSDLSIVSPKNNKAVQILTIHKAKGLEFPIVIFPNNENIHKEIDPKEWYNPKQPSDYNNFKSLLINGGKRLEKTDAVGQERYKQTKEALELDAINLLYVGLTRAEEQLYIVTELSSKSAKSTTYGLIFQDYLAENSSWEVDKNTYTFGKKNRPKQIEITGVDKTDIIHSKYISTDWQSHNIKIVSNASKYWNKSQEVAAIQGTLLHDILSEIKTEDDIDSALNHYFKSGKITKEEALNFKEILTQLVNHTDLQKYFSNSVTVYNECEIVTKSKLLFRLDRLVIEGNNAVIIDYKTGKPHNSHHEQLHDYAMAIKDMNLTVIKKILVYLENPIKVVFVD